MYRPRWLLTALVTVALWLSVCVHASAADEKKVTKENFDKIKAPMWQSEVEKLLGESDSEEVIPSKGGDFIIKTWKTKEVIVKVRFRNGYYNGSKSFDKK